MKSNMVVYVANNGTKEKLKFIQSSPMLGLMFTPFDYKTNWTHRYALDNGAFSSYTQGTNWYGGRLIDVLEELTKPDFVVLPDIVAGGKPSLNESIAWRKVLPDSYNYYCAIQDGMKVTDMPSAFLDKIGGVFIGGSVNWKMKSIDEWVEFAHKHGLKCHVGRIGTLQRLLICQQKGVDSVDSSNFAQNECNWKDLIEYTSADHKSLESFVEVRATN